MSESIHFIRNFSGTILENKDILEIAILFLFLIFLGFLLYIIFPEIE